jgi:hypothetical protein
MTRKAAHRTRLNSTRSWRSPFSNLITRPRDVSPGRGTASHDQDAIDGPVAGSDVSACNRAARSRPGHAVELPRASDGAEPRVEIAAPQRPTGLRARSSIFPIGGISRRGFEGKLIVGQFTDVPRSAADGVITGKHFPRDDGTRSQGEEFEDGVFLAGQVHRLVVDKDNSGIEIDDQLVCPGRIEIRRRL